MKRPTKCHSGRFSQFALVGGNPKKVVKWSSIRSSQNKSRNPLVGGALATGCAVQRMAVPETNRTARQPRTSLARPETMQPARAKTGARVLPDVERIRQDADGYQPPLVQHFGDLELGNQYAVKQQEKKGHRLLHPAQAGDFRNDNHHAGQRVDRRSVTQEKLSQVGFPLA